MTLQNAPCRRNYARWRALCLSLVYVVFGIHILHWKTSGKTLAPLELNEVMYTLELGIITAGFLFMCLLALGTLVFGRFFCSWACHIMVLQDLCAWILRRLGIRQKPIRSRLLLLVPMLTAFYMFIWPQVVRAWQSKGFPKFQVLTDREGWASFVTDNFWRNLPGPAVIILTFLVCGFAIVYLLGSRTFCTYVCPYGAIFALADRFSPARIKVNEKCRQCGTCTAACTCGIRVHEEVKQYGMVVNPACLKDLDCVSACPNRALRYGFSRPAFFKSATTGRFGSLPYDLSWAEEVLTAVVFIVVLLTFRGLYGRVPFLLSLALGAIIGYLVVVVVRLAARRDVMLGTICLRKSEVRGAKIETDSPDIPLRSSLFALRSSAGTGGRTTLAGWIFGVFMLLLGAFVAHSAFVRYHEFTGLKQSIAFRKAADTDTANALAANAYPHLLTAERWGFLRNIRVERSLLTLAGHLQRFDDVDKYARRVLQSQPGDISATLQLGQGLMQQERTSEATTLLSEAIGRWGGDKDNPPPELARAHQALGDLLARRGEFAAAAQHLETAIALGGGQAEVYAELGATLAELGRLEDAVASLREAVRLDPQLSGAQYNLGTMLGHLGRFAEAIPYYQQALATAPDDAELHNNLGHALMQVGQLEQSREHLERAVAIDPNNADAHFNLGSVFAAQQQTDQAVEHYRAAARLDPRYARLLGAAQPGG